MGVRGKGTTDRLRTTWTPEMDRYFIDLMLEQLNKGNRFDDHVFSKTAWTSMNSSFNEKLNSEYETDVLKNRHKTLRNVYKSVKNLLNQKGFNWDSTRLMVVADNKTWDEYIKVNPDVRSYRVKTLPYYDDLCAIYGDNIAGKRGCAVPEISSHFGEGKEGSVLQEVSDISESTLNVTTSPLYGRTRMYWQPPMDRLFIQLMVEQVHNGNRIDGLFCKQAWMEMIATFNSEFNSNYDIDILKNRYKTLRRQYNVIKNILRLDGFAWDDERQMVIADDSVWQDYIKGHKNARQFTTRPVPYFRDLCLICNSPYPDESGGFGGSKPESVVREVSSEDEIGDLLEPACLDSNTAGSSRYYKRRLENKSSSVHSKKSRSVDDSMASALREMASAVSSLTEKDDCNSSSVSIENVIKAVQALPDVGEDLILDACDFLEDEVKAKTFMALDVKLRKKWLLRKLRPQQ